MIGTENFWWSGENYCDSPQLRGKVDGFSARRDSGNIIETRIRPLGRLGPAAQPHGLTQRFFLPGAGLTYPHLDPTPVPGYDRYMKAHDKYMTGTYLVYTELCFHYF
jgi:hypothetical protein